MERDGARLKGQVDVTTRPGARVRHLALPLASPPLRTSLGACCRLDTQTHKHTAARTHARQHGTLGMREATRRAQVQKRATDNIVAAPGAGAPRGSKQAGGVWPTCTAW